MKSFRTLASAVVVSLIAFGAMSASASAQSARGTFKLGHEVQWQDAAVPAGEYEFSLEPSGAASLLTLRSRSGSGQGFILLVKDVRQARPADLNRLVLVSRTGKSFVRSLELSSFGTTLNFTVPPETATNEIALAGNASGPTPTH